MRYTVSAIALASLLSLPVGTTFCSAQQDTPPANEGSGMQNMHRMHPMTTDEQLAHLASALNLSSDQQGQIKPLLDQRRQQMMAIHGDQSLSREDRMAKMQTLDDDTHGKIAALLNPDQKGKYEQMAQRREQNMEKHNGGNAQPQQ